MDIMPAARNNRHLVVFNVAPYGFCAPATEVGGIIEVPHVRPLPQAPPSVIGLANHRGEVYRVISLRRKLGLESGPPRVAGQLILTRLPSGRAAFLVDEVVDVLPADRLVWRPLSPHSPMDFFDAFLVRDGQILFHTTFAQMEQAGETPYPSPDLAELERKAAATVPPPSPRESSPPPDAAETRNQEEAPSRATGAAAPLKQEPPQVQKADTRDYRSRPLPAVKPSLVPRSNAGPKASPRPPHPGSSETPSAASPRNNRRSRRFGLALITLLVVLLIVVLSSALLMITRLSLRQKPLQPVTATPPPPASTIDPAPEPPPRSAAVPVAPTPPLTQKHLAPEGESPAAVPPRRENAPPMAPSGELFPVPGQTLAEKDASVEPPAAADPSREILRLDTDAFTLTVERPNPGRTAPIPTQAAPASAPAKEIVHRVVPGDTLWDIAAHYLGDPFAYPELARLSQIRNPDLIYPGDIIRIQKKSALPKGKAFNEP